MYNKSSERATYVYEKRQKMTDQQKMAESELSMLIFLKKEQEKKENITQKRNIGCKISERIERVKENGDLDEQKRDVLLGILEEQALHLSEYESLLPLRKKLRDAAISPLRQAIKSNDPQETKSLIEVSRIYRKDLLPIEELLKNAVNAFSSQNEDFNRHLR